MPCRLLAEQGHDLTVFYANSNIAPAAEYEKRLAELQKYAASQGLRVIEGTYDPAAWERTVAPIGESIKEFSPVFGAAFAIKHAGASSVIGPSNASAAKGETNESGTGESGNGYGGMGESANVSAGGGPTVATVAELLDDERRRERCRACYRLRLEEAAAAAAEGGYDGLATTLAVSPYQFTDVIHEELQRAAGQVGLQAHFEDYRPYYDEATRISRELGMYRQNYCGCRFSIREGEATRAFVKEQRKAAKAARAAQRAADEQAVKKRKAEKAAYAETQAKKLAILKSLRTQK